MKNLNQFEKEIGVNFNDKHLFEQAFVHRSYINENPKYHLEHNERLEFLGDAVLELIVTDYLYKTYSDKPEGDLTLWRAALVNSQNLSQLAGKLNMGDYLLLSRGEAKDIGRGRQYILANVFEALIGAIYLDQGYEQARKFIEKNLLPELKIIISQKLYRDAKSRFQEEAQERSGITPTYEVLKEWGPDHDKRFQVGVFLDKELYGAGEGASKQDAQQKAAEDALEKKNW